MIGKEISHYKILEKLGEGGMGVVYKAEDTKLDRFVALKFLPLYLSQSEEEKQRFIYEAKAASALDHNNICTVYEIDETEDGQMFIAMACYEGESLKEKIERGPMAIEEAIDIATQISRGLTKAHSKEIIHRDIKPANLLIAEDDTVKIVDFGLAKLAGRTMLTKEGTTLGTVSYMSPEQTLGVEVDHRTDIWSFGVVLFEMLTGEQPFKGDYEQAIIYSILNEDPQSLPNTREDVPAELNKILTKTLQKKPNDRYESMGEILADLNKISTQPKTPSLPQVEKKIPSIAVLPFVNMSADPENEYFSDGLAEDIINALTKIKRFRVAARTSAFSFKGKEVHIREIGRELNVETVLEGSVRKAGTRLRITAQLINVANGYHLWSEQYDRTMDDVFAIQDEITLAIVENLKVELLREEREVLEKRYTENLEAYNLYLKGRHFWNKRNEQGFMKAIDYFQQAIDKDKLYALAYTGLADCYNLIPWYSNFPPKEAYPKAKAAAAKALKIDNSLAESHNSLAWSIMFYDWDWAGAEREFKKAIELNPNYATAHHWYAFYSIYMARFDQSIAEIKRAQEIDPLSLVINEDVGMLFYYARQYDQAIEALQRTIELDSNFSYAHFYLGWVYLQQTKYEKALTEFLKEKELTKAWNPFIETYIGVTYALMGKKSKAQQVLDYLTKTTKGTYISPYLLAILYCAFGKHDESFSWLDKALEDRHILLCFLKVDPVFNNLRSDSRFNELLKKMGLEK